MEIKIIHINRKDWLKDMPNLIRELKLNYNFYYKDRYICITNNIQNIVTNGYDKHRHQIVIYTNRKTQDWYLVVYAKKRIKVYWCDGYKYMPDKVLTPEDKQKGISNKSQWASIKRFMNKFALAYEGAVNEQIIQDFQKSKDFA